MQNNLDINALQHGTVVDKDGDKVGKVGQIYLDDQTDQPSFATVNTGLFGTKETFVPLTGAQVEGDTIRVPYEKSFIKDAPNMDADGHLGEREQDELFRYYGAGGAAGGVAGGRRDGDVDRDRTVRDGDVDRDRNLRDGDVDRDRDVRAGDRDVRDHDRTDDGSMTLRGEEVNVGKERVEKGQVRLRKHVVTDTKTVEVPVEREEFEVVREPVTDGRRGGELGEDEASVTLHEERPVVNKETVEQERIGLQKQSHTDTERVSADVSHEEAEVVREGGHADGRDGRSAGDKVKDKLDRDNDGKIGR